MNLCFYLDGNNNNVNNSNNKQPQNVGQGQYNTYQGNNNNNNNNLIQNFNPNQYMGKGPMDIYNKGSSTGPLKNNAPSIAFSNYIFSQPENSNKGLRQGPNSGVIKPDGSDFIK